MANIWNVVERDIMAGDVGVSVMYDGIKIYCRGFSDAEV